MSQVELESGVVAKEPTDRRTTGQFFCLACAWMFPLAARPRVKVDLANLALAGEVVVDEF